MDALRIVGGKSLEGTVVVSGAKNAALPALAASLLTAGEVILHDVPGVRDVSTMLRVLDHLGAEGSQDGSTTRVRCPRIRDTTKPRRMMGWRAP